MTIQPNQLDTKLPYDLTGFEEASSVHVSKDKGEACVFTVVNTENHGKRAALAAILLEAIDSPEAVKISFNHQGIAISGGSKFKLRESGKKGVIYSAQLVEEITARYDLDFTNRSSISFSEMHAFINSDGEPAVFIPIVLPESPVAEEETDHAGDESGDL